MLSVVRFWQCPVSLADPECGSVAAVVGLQPRQAAFLGAPAGDPEEAVVAGERLGGGIGVGGLGIVDVGHAVDDRDDLLAMGEEIGSASCRERVCQYV